MNIVSEFDRQLKTLIDKGYPEIAGLSLSAFRERVDGLKEKLLDQELPEVDLLAGHLPFVIVVKHGLVPTIEAVSRIEKDGKTGITKLDPLFPTDFEIIPTMDIPRMNIYLLLDIDRGKDSINQRPIDAMKLILDNGRFPLTIDEGVAIVTQFPEFLIKNNCFSLLGSRHTGDKRVPAIWINGKKHPNLGWCWDGNPHTWLGSASGKKRIGV
jgi:hypothetical protein